MKTIIVKNVQIQFDSFDEGADKHTATATLDEINEVLQERFSDINPQIFVNAIDDDDIEITPEDPEDE
jgi:molybdopterin/thiamine biosynthesis adenylyltransferase